MTRAAVAVVLALLLSAASLTAVAAADARPTATAAAKCSLDGKDRKLGPDVRHVAVDDRRELRDGRERREGLLPLPRAQRRQEGPLHEPRAGLQLHGDPGVDPDAVRREGPLPQGRRPGQPQLHAVHLIR